ncbi:MAG TPA: beta-L-arabinofuranosidase domain-containing protein [Candidatus Sulfotelmatobacter sp.]|nr:beta-L-arabinofuranosidase domain-containing protein [Candidatus Sulfotelmatobacter sp.]
MSPSHAVSRRKFLQSVTLASAASVIPGLRSSALALRSGPFFSDPIQSGPLEEFGYGDVTLHSALHEGQLQQTHDLLMSLSEDSLLKPFRQMVGQPAPGEELGGWYQYDAHNEDHLFEIGFAPGCTFGQWVSALARAYAINRSPETREKVLRLNRLYAKAIGGDFYEKTRFPAYTYDKLVCGLIDSQKYVGDLDAFAILAETTKAALPHLPPKAVEHGLRWRSNPDDSYTWDESYTISENLFLAYQRGAGDQYRALGLQYLDDVYYDPLAEGRSNLEGRHAYSHVNSLCSAMQAYLTVGSEKHLRAAKNGFDFVTAQSFATGGWGADETLRAPGSSEVFKSLTGSHASFETPCGSYAHFKLTRYLLRVTRDSRYGDSMERVMYNTVLGSLPLEADGRTYYYSDYNFKGRKVYHKERWACCSGTLPQVAADYRINTYFRDGRGVYVNLYIPSTLQWVQSGAQVELTQKSEYPYDAQVEFEVRTSKRVEFAVNLRIPAWAAGASIAVNGKRETASAGSFASVQRKWTNGDRIELALPLTARLEAIDAQHPETVALLVGPVVLFAVTGGEPKVTRTQLLAARKIGAQSWQVETAGGAMKMLPFTAIEDQEYSTYLRVG